MFNLLIVSVQDLSDLPPVTNPRVDDTSSVPERDSYEKLCRGEFIHVIYY